MINIVLVVIYKLCYNHFITLFIYSIDIICIVIYIIVVVVVVDDDVVFLRWET